MIVVMTEISRKNILALANHYWIKCLVYVIYTSATKHDNYMRHISLFEIKQEMHVFIYEQIL